MKARQDMATLAVDQLRPRRPPLPSSISTRALLIVTLATAGVFYTWSIGYVGLSSYYAAGARSMAANSEALMFGALDPASSITLDKLSGFLLPQTLAVAMFGFHAWVLAAPQVVEGLVTVLAGFVIGRRWRGDRGGLALAWLLATTPVLAAMFGRPMEDGMLTMCQVLAFAALQRFLLSDRSRWLFVAGVWIAIGFQAKMMQSWLLLPALLIIGVLAGPGGERLRLIRAMVAIVVCVALSVAWMSAIQMVQAGARPFVDGTTDNNIFSMVFGYNGFDRLLPGIVPGAVPQLSISHSASGGTRTAAAATSALKLLQPEFSTQIGWLYPLTLVGIVVAAADAIQWLCGDHRSRRRQVDVVTTVGLAVWLLVPVVVLSMASVPHATYFGVIALPIAAFAVNGMMWAVRRIRARAGSVFVSLLVLVQAAWDASIVWNVPQLRPLAAVLFVLGAVGAVTLVCVPRTGAGRLLRLGAASSLLAALLGPLVWSSFVLGVGGGGTATDGFAGPRIGASSTASLVVFGEGRGLIHLHLPFGVPPDRRLSPADRHLLQYVRRRNRAGVIPFASDSMSIVIAVILGSRTSPLPMGGYSGHAPEPSLVRFVTLITSDRLRFVLLQDRAQPRPLTGSVVRSEAAWVRAHCRDVLSGRFLSGSTHRQTLYDCRAARRP